MFKDYNYVIHDSLNKYRDQEWKFLEDKNETLIFQSLNWLKYWMKINSKSEAISSIRIIFIYYKRELVMIIPLCIRKLQFNIKCLTWMGFPYNDICFPIIKDNYNFEKDVFLKLWTQIINEEKNKFDTIVLNNQLFRLSKKINPFLKSFKSIRSNNNYQIIKIEFDKYTNNLNLKANSDVFKKIKMLNKKGEVRYNFSDTNKSNQIIKFILENKTAQYKKKRKDHIFINNLNKDFIKNLDELEESVFSSLTLNDKLIAAHIGYLYKESFYHIMPTHNIEFKKYSPGTIILYNMVKSFFDMKLKKFDFTIGSEFYKKRWSNNYSYLYTYLSPISIKGFFFYIYSIMRIKIINNFLNKK